MIIIPEKSYNNECKIRHFYVQISLECICIYVKKSYGSRNDFFLQVRIRIQKYACIKAVDLSFKSISIIRLLKVVSHKSLRLSSDSGGILLSNLDPVNLRPDPVILRPDSVNLTLVPINLRPDPANPRPNPDP